MKPFENNELGPLFPPGVFTALCPILDFLDDLFPEESNHVANAVRKRQREFAAGRRCARMLMDHMHVLPQAIPVSSARAPLWPSGVVGSISHTDNFCAAALASSSDFLGLGVDIEIPENLALTFSSLILTPKELGRLSFYPPSEVQNILCLAFSAKESFFKAQHPITGINLDFLDVTIHLDLARNTFTVESPIPLSSTPKGAFLCTPGLVATGVWIAND